MGERVSQAAVEALVLPTVRNALVSQDAVEVLILPEGTRVLVSQICLEVLVENIPLPVHRFGPAIQ